MFMNPCIVIRLWK